MSFSPNPYCFWILPKFTFVVTFRLYSFSKNIKIRRTESTVCTVEICKYICIMKIPYEEIYLRQVVRVNPQRVAGSRM
jgi:hypothetical protein